MNKIVCQLNGAGSMVATVRLDSDEWAKLLVTDLIELKHNLEHEEGSQLRDFCSVRHAGPPAHYEVSMTMGFYALPWQETEELIRFRNAIEKLARVVCWIDCSPLSGKGTCTKRGKAVPA